MNFKASRQNLITVRLLLMIHVIWMLLYSGVYSFHCFQDVNDIPPVFTSVPRPVTLDDDVPIGTTVINLIATDSDGTAPGNQVDITSNSCTILEAMVQSLLLLTHYSKTLYTLTKGILYKCVSDTVRNYGKRYCKQVLHYRSR